jgi:uncharacterized protein YfaS (alpha-2-macroglobulin family)
MLSSKKHMMNSLLALIMLLPVAQVFGGNDYENEWKKVASYEKQGLPASAKEVVEVIYNMAKKEDNGPQKIKALMFLARYTQELEEESIQKIIQLFQQEINESKAPEKNIAESLLAEIYWQYYTENRYAFIERTNIAGGPTGEDISTWDLPSIAAASMELFLSSVQTGTSILQSTPVQKYDAILTESDADAKIIRPSLYDLLAHRAIQFLSNDEVYITKAAERFEITEPIAFSTGSDFGKNNFTHADSNSGQLAALKIYQQLSIYHQADPYADALIELHLERLSFVYNHCSISDKDSLYLDALINLTKQYSQTDAVASVYYTIAELKVRQGNQYHAVNNPEPRFLLMDAVHICNEVIQRFPNTRGSENCQALLSRLLSKELYLEVERENSINKPFRIHVTWKNVDTVWFRIYRKTPSIQESFGIKNPKEVLHEILQTQPLQAWVQQLPADSNDHQRHNTEVAAAALPAGTYIIISSSSERFVHEGEQLNYTTFHVTDFSYIQYATPDGEHELYVLNRNTGLPVPNTRIQTELIEYDYDERKYIQINNLLFTTDKSGFARITGIKNGSLNFTLIKGNDTLPSYDRLYFREPYTYNESPTHTTSHVFTDRAIYRPGQTVYCKGIVLNKSNQDKQQQVAAGIKTVVQLYDANRQVVAEQMLVTNEYGSYQTVFQLPQGVLTGQFTIQDNWSSVSFSVEEYKRPSFEVLAEPVSGQFGLHDTVEITGKAVAYTGMAISSGTVQYRVIRNTIIPYYSRGYWPYPAEEAAEIAQGTTTTDDQGVYRFSFITHPGKTNTRPETPYYTYTAYIDVTDVSGETRSTSYSISAGEIGLLLELQVDETVTIGDSLRLITRATNLNGMVEKTDIIIAVYPLQSPIHAYRNRYWEPADLYALSKETYQQLFPLDEYAGETDPKNWAFGREVSRHLMTDNQVLDVSTKNWQPGTYKIICSATDKNGVEVRNEQYIVAALKESAPPVQTYLYAPKTSFIAEPGEQIDLTIALPFGKGLAKFSLYRGNELISSKWLQLSNKYTHIPIQITEADRGGLSAQISLVKDGRYHEQNYYITVPWTNKELKMELLTFRTSSLPGSKETWQLKISGPDGSPADAELLATLYDASLDVFTSHWWSFTNYPFHYSSLTWRSGATFSYNRFEQTGENWNSYFPGSHLRHATINWFGFQFYRQQMYYMFDLAGDMREESDESEGNMQLEKSANATIAIPVAETDNSVPAIRTNFNETAFFYPQVYGDSNGVFTLTFTLPESLTRWKMLTLAHTKNVESGGLEAAMVTKKELMVTPNLPRFFREGDTITLAARIANMSDSTMEGFANLHVTDALTGNTIPQDIIPIYGPKHFQLSAGGNTSASWEIIIPENFSAVTCTFSATANGHTDGEVHTLPVLSNRVLLTESLPLRIKWGEEKDYVFHALQQSGSSKTIEHKQLKVEISSNPAWYAVKSLPYLMEYPYECTEQLFNRYYANSMASFIANSNPRLQQIFEQWKGSSESLLSNLEKNQELKSALLEETPWVLEAQNETERNKRVGVLFDLNKMKYEQEAVLNKLIKAQTPNGGFSWFPGMPDDPIITNYLLAGWAHLNKLGVTHHTGGPGADVIASAIHYADNRLNEWYAELTKVKTDLSAYQPGYREIQYLYMRSYFSDVEMDDMTQTSSRYFTGQIKKYWTAYDLQSQAMMAMIFLSQQDRGTAEAIVHSLKERSINNEATGMYWKENRSGYSWWQAPIETQALMIELFHQMGYTAETDALRWWLLSQKQTNSWASTKATAEACYALLLQGNNWLDQTGMVTVALGGQALSAESIEAGTGYYESVQPGKAVNATQANIHLDARSMGEKGGSQAWGAIYWQYEEDLDQIKPTAGSETPLNISQEIYLKVNTASGQQLVTLGDKQSLKIGDLAVIRLTIDNNRDVDYVHIKGLRAACFEPIDVISGYHWRDGMGYYMSTRDASTNFFIDHLAKGKYVLEYEVRVTQSGTFSGGISTIQCMYAPELVGHSAGKRITVE